MIEASNMTDHASTEFVRNLHTALELHDEDRDWLQVSVTPEMSEGFRQFRGNAANCPIGRC